MSEEYNSVLSDQRESDYSPWRLTRSRLYAPKRMNGFRNILSRYPMTIGAALGLVVATLGIISVNTPGQKTKNLTSTKTQIQSVLKSLEGAVERIPEEAPTPQAEASFGAIPANHVQAMNIFVAVSSGSSKIIELPYSHDNSSRRYDIWLNNPKHGDVKWIKSGEGRVLFTPKADFIADSFTYKITEFNNPDNWAIGEVDIIVVKK